MGFEIKLAYQDLDLIRELFCEYRDSLKVDLCFQSFKEELDTLPGKYALPYGRLYIATCNDQLAGCVALRPLDTTVCEMKRLYVRPQFRGMGLGEQLARRVINDATGLKYSQMCLDTLDSLKSAVKLYGKLGFTEIKPYYKNPLNGVLYLGLNLPGKNSLKDEEEKTSG